MHALGGVLNNAPDKRTLEVIALTVAVLRKSPYLWRGHAFLAAIRLRVLSVAEVARIAAGPSWLSPADALFVRVVTELLDGDLSSASKAELGSRALRVTVATRFYDLIATLTREFAPEPGTPVVPRLETYSDAIRWIDRPDAA